MTTIRRVAICCLVLTCASLASATTEETLRLPSGQRISIRVPTGYSFEANSDELGNRMVQMENPVWGISITVKFVAEDDPEIETARWQQNAIISFLSAALPDSAEGDYRFKPLGPAVGTGTYCVLTDKNLAAGKPPPPGEYGYMTGGIKAWPGCVVAFRIMSNSITSEEYREVFELFRTSFEER